MRSKLKISKGDVEGEIWIWVYGFYVCDRVSSFLGVISTILGTGFELMEAVMSYAIRNGICLKNIIHLSSTYPRFPPMPAACSPHLQTQP